MAMGNRLRELAAIEGFSGAAVFSPAGQLLLACGGDPQLEAVGLLANGLLQEAKTAAYAIGGGRGQQVHLAGDKAHVLVGCLNEGTDPLRSQPGRAHFHLVVILGADADVGAARERMAASLRALADELRGRPAPGEHA